MLSFISFLALLAGADALVMPNAPAPSVVAMPAVTRAAPPTMFEKKKGASKGSSYAVRQRNNVGEGAQSITGLVGDTVSAATNLGTGINLGYVAIWGLVTLKLFGVF